MRKNISQWSLNIFIGSLVLFVCFSFFRLYKAEVFDKYCGDYILRAAKAYSLTDAKRELSTAINYAKENNLTGGNTGFLYNTPREDIGFWYTNMVNSLQKLENINEENSSKLEVSNMLIKLGQSLTYVSSDRPRIMEPSGISVAPYNKSVDFIGWFLFITMTLSLAIFMIYDT